MSSPTSWVIVSRAILASYNEIFGPPVTLIIASLAPATETSNKGEEIARFAASFALSSPDDIPIPINAFPLFFITAQISAKSRLINAGTAIKSVIVWTPCLNTLSASLNASCIGRPPISCNKRSFETTIILSTLERNSSIPSIACFLRFIPSKVNGLVITPTVNAPNSRAILAKTGAAPVPVPPPIPAAMKTISAPSRAVLISPSDSKAAFFPTSGLPPAPKPFVKSFPKTILFSTGERRNTCTSVFATKNSTPLTPSSTMRLTALFPPPPTPITFIFATCSKSNSSFMIYPLFYLFFFTKESI